MPYHWITSPNAARQELSLWPHNALSPQGFAAMVLGFFLAASIPLYGLLGTVLLWGLLPFMLAATGGLYYALRRNARDRQILETLVLTPETTTLTRQNPGGEDQNWQSNTHWVTVALHPTGGPVPNYITLKGGSREVEIGAFLAEEERKALFSDLDSAIRRAKESC